MKWLPILFDSVPTYDRGLRLVQHAILSLFFVSFNYLHKKNIEMNKNISYNRVFNYVDISKREYFQIVNKQIEHISMNGHVCKWEPI